MIFNDQEQTILLILRSFIAGMLLCVVYDVVFEALFKVKHRKLLFGITSFVFDFFFCILCACVSILLMYYANKGFFRSLVFIFMILGFVCFRISVGRLLRKILSAVYGVLLIPVRFVKNKMISLFHLTIGKIIGKIVSKARKTKEEIRQKRQKKPLSEPETPKEDFVYVANGTGYKKSGRIKF